jgi:hypothetical protein
MRNKGDEAVQSGALNFKFSLAMLEVHAITHVNFLGSEVAHVFSGELAAGEHSFVWSNPTGLPDGTYECLIRFNGQVEMLPIVLQR